MLTLIGRSFTDQEVESLCRSEAGQSLSRLEMPYSRLTGEGIRVLSETTGLPSLRALDLSNSRFADGVVRPLLNSKTLSGLKRLNLFDTGLTSADVSLLACGGLPSLVALNLGNNAVGDAGAVSLSLSPNLAGLERLWLDRCRIGDAGLIALVLSESLSRLEVLSLSGNGLGPDGLVALANSPRMSNLVELNLSGNDHREFAGRLGATLAGSAHLKRLKKLWLDGIDLDESDVQALMDSPNWPQLETIRANRARLSIETWLGMRQRTKPRLLGAQF